MTYHEILLKVGIKLQIHNPPRPCLNDKFNWGK
jgi:hypothetical protein